MEFQVYRKPCMLLETVELVYSYVNQVPAEQLTEWGVLHPRQRFHPFGRQSVGPLIWRMRSSILFQRCTRGWKGTTFILPGLLHGLQHPESRLQQRGGDGPFPEKWMVLKERPFSGLWHQWNWPGPDCC